MKVLTKRQLLAIDNLAILLKAKNDGLTVDPDDSRINYAEMDHTLTSKEDSWQVWATAKMTKAFIKWLSGIEKAEDLDPAKLNLGMQPLLMDFIQDVWDYGQMTAEEELRSMESSFAEKSGGKGREGDLTNDDAFAWYQLYAKELAKAGQDAAFVYMQPLILEKLDQGRVRLDLARELEEDFRRFGQVRTKIIARTESNKAFNWGRRYRFDKSPAIAGYRYSAIMDERTTEICQALHGHSWEIGDPGLDLNTPPNHYQCRSVIVAISKYRSFTFDPPPAGWEADLPDQERKVYDKFKDSTFYPKAGTVIQKKAPKMAAPKKKAIPKAKKAAAAPVKSLGDVSHLKLEADDLEALQKFDDLIKGVDFSQDRRKLSKELLKRAGLDHMKVSIRKLSGALGRVDYYDRGYIDTTDFSLHSADVRDKVFQTRTIFHEYYHAHFTKLSHDYDSKNKYSPYADKISREDWLMWEETATEAASHYMLQRAGIGSGTIPSYSNYLIRTLPLLKQLEEFEDCVTVEDFGAKFMKYRFSEGSKSAKWKDLHEQTKGIKMDWDPYYEAYEDYILDNEDLLLGMIYLTYADADKIKHRQAYENYIRKGIKGGLKNSRSYGDIYAMALMAAMQKEGIK